jgi:phage terminase small subunit
MAPLKNAKHEAFARAIVEGRTNADAYGVSGYKVTPAAAAANGSRLLKNAKVSTRIAELKAAAAEKTAISAARVIEELAKIGFANMADYMRVGIDGDPRLHFDELSRDQAAALQEVTVDTYLEGHGDDAREVKRVKFRLADKRAALVDLGKHLGIFAERHKHEHTGAGGGPIETKSADELPLNEIARRIAFALIGGNTPGTPVPSKTK